MQKGNISDGRRSFPRFPIEHIRYNPNGSAKPTFAHRWEFAERRLST